LADYRIYLEGDSLVFRYADRRRAEQLARRRPRLRLVDEPEFGISKPRNKLETQSDSGDFKSVLRHS